jgi:hypothetical protein
MGRGKDRRVITRRKQEGRRSRFAIVATPMYFVALDAAGPTEIPVRTAIES